MITVDINKRDVNYLQNMMKKAEKKTVKFANNMVQNIAIVFFQKAAANTAPGKKQKISKMSKKYRVNRVVSNPVKSQMSRGGFWYRKTGTGVVFKSRRQITRREMKARGLESSRRALKFWNKKKNKWDYKGTLLSLGLHEGRKITRINGYGAGKAAWSMGIRNLNGKNQDTGRIKANVAHTVRIRGDNPLITHINRVDYVGKTSPGVVGKAMASAVQHFKKKEQRKYEKMVKKEFKPNVNN